MTSLRLPVPPSIALLLALAGGIAVASEPASRPDGKAEPKPEAAAVAAAPAADPLDRLRQRLVERLSAPATAESPGALDVRITSRAAPRPASPARPAATARTGAATAAGAAAMAAPAHGAGQATPPWGYEGPVGPAAWGGIRPEFALCGKGQRQSPIDIRGGLAVDLAPVKFDYQPAAFGVIDNGHTVQVNVKPGNAIEVGGRRFELVQFHFHRPAEERIDGRSFEMSIHLMHRDPQGRLAVVALLVDRAIATTAPQPVVQQVWNHLPLEKHEENAAREKLDLAALLPDDRRYYTYMGSLTTPPCTEGVQWIVMRTPVLLTAEQIELFARIYPMNARPVQSAGGRRILQSQ